MLNLKMSIEPVGAFQCSECLEIREESNGPIYECGNCGNTFSKEDEGTHRCSDCGKFASKLAEDSIDCGCSAGASEIVAYHCETCDELIAEDDAENHECGVEPEKPATPEHRFAVGQRVEVVAHSDVDPFCIHAWFEPDLSEPPPHKDMRCRGPAVVTKYLQPASPTVKRIVVIECEEHHKSDVFAEGDLRPAPEGRLPGGVQPERL